DGQVYGDSQDLRIGWQAVDSTSGVRTLGGTLGGDAYTRRRRAPHEPTPGGPLHGAAYTGRLQALYELTLGVHALKVTAVDNAGNTTTQTVTFGITTSTRDISLLIDRFRSVGWLNQAT